MKRFFRIALAGVFAVVTSASVEAQQKGPGTQGGAGQTKPGQGAGQTTPGQGAGQTTPGQGAGQTTPGQGAGQTKPGQGAGQTTPGQQGAYHGGIGQSPWFSNPDVRQQFKLNDTQYNQLNKNYGESYGRYQQGMKSFGNDLTDAQRTQRMGDLQQRFNNDMSTSANKVFTDPQQRQRYNQLNMQYQGYNAFSNPTVQEKLNLTAEQRQQLGQQGQAWHKQMEGLGRTYGTDRDGTTKQYNDMRKMYGQQINTVLTPEQQRSWQNMTGAPYSFPASDYFQTNVVGGTTTPVK